MNLAVCESSRVAALNLTPMLDGRVILYASLERADDERAHMTPSIFSRVALDFGPLGRSSGP